MANNLNNRLEIIAGDSKTFFVLVSDSSGSPFILEGYSPILYAKKFPIRKGAIPEMTILGTVYDASAGGIKFELTQSDTSIATGDYEYQVVIDSSLKLHTVVSDRLSIFATLK